MTARRGLAGVLLTAILALAAPVQGGEPAERPPGAVAWQGGATVTLRDVDARMARVPDHVRAEVMNDPMRIQDVVGSLLVNRQLAQRAVELGLDEDALFEAELAIIREEVLARRYLEHAANAAPPADLEALAREEYLANRERYRQPGGPRVSHILVSTAERSESDALARAREVLTRIESGELAFVDAVKAYSDDPSHRVNLGEVGIVDDSFDPDFRKAAESLREPGQLSGVVRSQFGMHIIRLEGIDEPRVLEFEEVRPGLMAKVDSERKVRVRAELVDSVRALPLDADPDTVFSLRTRYRKDDAASRP